MIKYISTIHTYSMLSRFSRNAPPLDSRQAPNTASSAAGGTVWTDKHCGSSSGPQLQSACGWFGLKVLLAKMLTAEIGVWPGDPLNAGTLHLFLPFAKLLGVLGKFEQCHPIFWRFATSVGHTVVGHPGAQKRTRSAAKCKGLEPKHPSGVRSCRPAERKMVIGYNWKVLFR